MYGYIYLTTNTINGKKYIGQHARSFFDKKYLGSGTALKNAILKYGPENFKCEILCECDSQEELDRMEKLFIRENNACMDSCFYNITTGGRMCQLPFQSEETKAKISSANKGKKRTQEQNERNSIAKKGSKWMHKGDVQSIIMRDEVQAHLSDGWKLGMHSRKAMPPSSPEKKQRISNALKGKPHSSEHRARQRLSLLSKKMHWYTNGVSDILIQEGEVVPEGFYRGRRISESSKEKNRNAHIGKTPWNKGLHKKDL